MRNYDVEKEILGINSKKRKLVMMSLHIVRSFQTDSIVVILKQQSILR